MDAELGGDRMTANRAATTCPAESVERIVGDLRERVAEVVETREEA